MPIAHRFEIKDFSYFTIQRYIYIYHEKVWNIQIKTKPFIILVVLRRNMQPVYGAELPISAT